MTTKQMHEMVGCSVSYRGREAVITNAYPTTTGMLRLAFVDGGVGMLRPSEIGNSIPAIDPRITAGSAVAIDGVDLVAHVGGRELRVRLEADRFVFTGGVFGEHSLASDFLITNAARLFAHWQGYVGATTCAAAAS